VLLIALVLLLNAMAAVPALHEWVHRDADQAGHQCAVTLFAHGQVESSAHAVSVVLPAAATETAPHWNPPFSGTTLENLPPGRAPPSVVSSQI
jgi:hypothetical protein